MREGGAEQGECCCGKRAIAQFEMGIQIHIDGYRLPGGTFGSGSVSLGHR
jgi:hypothetical protein